MPCEFKLLGCLWEALLAVLKRLLQEVGLSGTAHLMIALMTSAISYYMSY